MVVRYPHTATVHVVTTTIADGEYSSESESTQDIKGRLEHSSVRVKTSTGDYTQLAATFFTSVRKITNAKKLTIDSRVLSIVEWMDYQNYSEIWLE
jgi:hypothetical protein